MALNWDEAPPPGAAPPGPAPGSPPWSSAATTELRVTTADVRRPPRRTLFTDDRGSGLRASWHDDREVVVLSLWRDDICAGTFQLPPEEAGRLARFLEAHAGLVGRRAS